jgi:hypothetical protein
MKMKRSIYIVLPLLAIALILGGALNASSQTSKVNSNAEVKTSCGNVCVQGAKCQCGDVCACGDTCKCDDGTCQCPESGTCPHRAIKPGATDNKACSPSSCAGCKRG